MADDKNEGTITMEGGEDWEDRLDEYSKIMDACLEKAYTVVLAAVPGLDHQQSRRNQTDVGLALFNAVVRRNQTDVGLALFNAVVRHEPQQELVALFERLINWYTKRDEELKAETEAARRNFYAAIPPSAPNP